MAKGKGGSKQGKDFEIAVPVTFGGVSIGATTARISCKVGRTLLALADADKKLCGRRLIGTIKCRPKGEAPNQKHLEAEGMATELGAAFDVKRIGFSPDDISFGLTAVLKDIDVAQLARFAQHPGELVVVETTAIPDDAADEHADKD